MRQILGIGRGILLGVAALFVLWGIANLFGLYFYVQQHDNVVVKRWGDIQYAVVTGYSAPGDKGQTINLSDEAAKTINAKRKAKQQDPQVAYMKQKYGSDIQVYEGAGLYFKAPWETAWSFDARIMDWEGDAKKVSTKDLRTLYVKPVARWRILDPVKFYKSVGPTWRTGLPKISNVVASKNEDLLSNTRLIEVVRNQNLQLDERVKKRLQTVGDEDVKAAKIRYGRSALLNKVKKSAEKELARRFGIELIDVLYVGLNYPGNVRQKVFERMQSERHRIAARYRSQGQRKKQRILGNVSERVKELVSGGERKVKRIKGEAEGKAIEIMADAFEKDQKFFRFRESINTYREAFDENTTVVLSNDSKLMEFVTSTSTE